MIQLESGITLDVNRGPNWLFFRLDPCAQASTGTLAADLWGEVSKHFTYRVVLEFSDACEDLSVELIEQLDLFRKQLEAHEGALRVCGLNTNCAERLARYCAESRMKSRILSHSSLANAVFGTVHEGSSQPTKPNAKTTQDTASEALRVH